MVVMRNVITATMVLLVFIVLPTGKSKANDWPDRVTIDSLEQHYNAVEFDHAAHVDLTDKNCAVCHHHTTGVAPEKENCKKCHEAGKEASSVACQDCHSANRFGAEYLKSLSEAETIFHLDKPGLKGAYHQNCLGCHKENGAPSGCQDCHPRKDVGDEFFHSGKYAPKVNAAAASGH